MTLSMCVSTLRKLLICSRDEFTYVNAVVGTKYVACNKLLKNNMLLVYKLILKLLYLD